MLESCLQKICVSSSLFQAFVLKNIVNAILCLYVQAKQFMVFKN